MEKFGVRKRDIRFYSEKNEKVVCVHSREARQYALRLETNNTVKSYETDYRLDPERYRTVSPVGIRGSRFQTEWASDFFVTYIDGSNAVIELAREDDLKKRAFVEKLEFSRRYWAAQDISKRAVALVGGGNDGD